MKTGISTCAMIVLALAIVGCGRASGEVSYHGGGSWRYKTTVTISTPEGDKTGSAVREVTVNSGLHLFPEGHARVDLKGEAVAVDLGPRGVVFALMKGYWLGSDYGKTMPLYAFKQVVGGFSDSGTQNIQNRLVGAQVVLTDDLYPMFVRFRDPADPKSVENLLDYKPCPGRISGVPNSSVCLVKSHFAEAFGEGVELKSVTVERTQEPVTVGSVVKYIPWLPERKNKQGTLGGGSSIFEDPTNTWLTGAEFSQGVYW